MTDTAITVSGLGKRYRIGAQQAYRTLREKLNETALAPFRAARHLLTPSVDGRRMTDDGARSSVVGRRSSSPTFWALRDVSFEVKRGEVVGIIGRNGAGKSTLLKILSRITEPTEGYADINGRIASLLEVGTGFHPELTGRENIFLNGSILGMKRAEIIKKFDEIVAFAEIERFIDTAVKYYSSGMYVRLAFAVAAHLDPEILLVDEVLAVGDAAFQKKCLGKMGDVARQGRTVLFVSHNLAAVNKLCPTTILLAEGHLQQFDESTRVVGNYLAHGVRNASTVDLTEHQFRNGNGIAAFEWAELRNRDRKPSQDYSIGDDVEITFRVRLRERVQGMKLAVELRTSDGLPICNMTDSDSGFGLQSPNEFETVTVIIKDLRLYPDTYYVSLWVGSPDSMETFDRVEDCLSLNIIDGGRLTMRHLPRSAGLLFLTPKWIRQSLASTEVAARVQ